MRSRNRTIIAVMFMTPLVLAACGAQDDGVLRQIAPGSTVYVDAWDDGAEEGDQALVEQKPSGVWVLPEDLPFSNEKTGDFTTKVSLTEDGQFVVEELGDKVGKDHDDCLATEEVYAVLAPTISDPAFEPDPEDADESNDDCERVQTED